MLQRLRLRDDNSGAGSSNAGPSNERSSLSPPSQTEQVCTLRERARKHIPVALVVKSLGEGLPPEYFPGLIDQETPFQRLERKHAETGVLVRVKRIKTSSITPDSLTDVLDDCDGEKLRPTTMLIQGLRTILYDKNGFEGYSALLIDHTHPECHTIVGTKGNMYSTVLSGTPTFSANSDGSVSNYRKRIIPILKDKVPEFLKKPKFHQSFYDTADQLQQLKLGELIFRSWLASFAPSWNAVTFLDCSTKSLVKKLFLGDSLTQFLGTDLEDFNARKEKQQLRTALLEILIIYAEKFDHPLYKISEGMIEAICDIQLLPSIIYAVEKKHGNPSLFAAAVQSNTKLDRKYSRYAAFLHSEVLAKLTPPSILGILVKEKLSIWGVEQALVWKKVLTEKGIDVPIVQYTPPPLGNGDPTIKVFKELSEREVAQLAPYDVSCGDSPLISAVYYNCIETARELALMTWPFGAQLLAPVTSQSRLLSSLTQLNVANPLGYSPVILALQLKRPDFVKILVEAASEIHFDSWQQQLFENIEKGDLLKVETVIASKIDINKIKTDQEFTPLAYALMMRQPIIARLLINNGAEIHIDEFDEVMREQLEIAMGEDIVPQPLPNPPLAASACLAAVPITLPKQQASNPQPAAQPVTQAASQVIVELTQQVVQLNLKVAESNAKAAKLEKEHEAISKARDAMCNERDAMCNERDAIFIESKKLKMLIQRHETVLRNQREELCKFTSTLSDITSENDNLHALLQQAENRPSEEKSNEQLIAENARLKQDLLDSANSLDDAMRVNGRLNELLDKAHEEEEFIIDDQSCEE